MIRSLLSLLGVLAAILLILALAYWTTRFLGTQGSRALPGLLTGSGDPAFAVLAQLGLGRGARLVLVRLGERCCLFSVTERQVQLVRELEPSESEHWLAGTTESPPPGFLEVLGEALKKGKKA